MKESRSTLFNRNESNCALEPHSVTLLRLKKDSRAMGAMVVNSGKLNQCLRLAN